MTGNFPLGHANHAGRFLVQTLDQTTGERGTAYYSTDDLIAWGFGDVLFCDIVVPIWSKSLNEGEW